MSFLSQIPDEFKQPGKKQELIEFLKSLPIRFHQKKYTLIEYCDTFGEKMTFDDVRELGGEF